MSAAMRSRGVSRSVAPHPPVSEFPRPAVLDSVQARRPRGGGAPELPEASRHRLPGVPRVTRHTPTHGAARCPSVSSCPSPLAVSAAAAPVSDEPGPIQDVEAAIAAELITILEDSY